MVLQDDRFALAEGVAEVFKTEGGHLQHAVDLADVRNVMGVAALDVDSLSFWDLKKISEQSHIRNWDRYVWTDWVNGYPSDQDPDPLGDLALTLFKCCKPGDKLYIGGVVSFHF